MRPIGHIENGMITANNPTRTIFPFHKQTCGKLFKNKNRRITRIEAIVIEVPCGMPSGWVR